jgi:hypothetical protein
MLLQLVQRASDFAPDRAGRTGFHLDQHRSGAWISNRPEGTRDRAIRDAGRASQRAKFRDRLGRREQRIESCFEQFRIVRIRFVRTAQINPPS